ncbi:MAG: helix-turn-helix domain-containing protein [Treponema sp.]|nr:helix-turn-helix domain-containing protein [Treponema sp.]
MGALGEKLKSIREERGWSYHYVSRETNIAMRYLEALEGENFSCFPGEPYALGFLKSYGEFLDINPDDLLSLYRSLKIQEQPVPVEQLFKPPSRFPKIIAITAVILVILGLVAGALYLIPRLPQRTVQRAQAAALPMRAAMEYTMNADFLERRFFPGDSIMVSNEFESHRLVFASLGDAVTLTTPNGQVMLDLGQEVTVNLSDSEFTALRIIAADFVRNNSATGALLRFEQTSMPQTFIHPLSPDMTQEEAFITPDAPRQEIITILPSSPNAFPFTLQAVFQDFCLFRYEILFEPGRQGRSENFYQRTQELSITAQNGIRLGISNARAVRLQVVGGGRTVPFEAGGPGEVVAADLRWIRDEDNRFRLVFIRLD